MGRLLRRRGHALGIRYKKFSKDVWCDLKADTEIRERREQDSCLTLVQFARLLNVSPESFFEGYEEPSSKKTYGRASLEEATCAMWHAIRELLALPRAFHKMECQRSP